MTTLLQDAAFVLERLAALGCTVHPQSRFAHIHRVLSNGLIEDGHKDFPAAREAMRDAQQMAFALRQLSMMSEDELKNKAQLAIDGALLPEHEGPNTPGRNYQAELYVAGVCAKAGLNPKFVEPPDLTVVVDGDLYGIAVKRVKTLSDGKLLKHVKDAASQILESKLAGYIILDLTTRYNPQNLPCIDIADHELDRQRHLDRTQFRDTWMPRISGRLVGANVRGVFILEHVVRRHPSEGWGLSTYTASFGVSTDNQRRYRQFMAFHHRFASGSATEPVPLLRHD